MQMGERREFSILLLAFFILGTTLVSATVFTIKNSCSYKIWPGTLAANGLEKLGDGGFELAPGATRQLPAPAAWSGRFWARTGCNFDGAGNGRCTTGDCSGGLRCTGSGATPVSLAEITLVPNDKDTYDVSLVDGYNVGIGIRPSGGTGDCRYAGCATDLNPSCPQDLKVLDNGNVVACKSACAAFNKPEYCCTGEYEPRGKCPPTDYSRIFKNACPDAYSYAHDDETSTFTCTGTDYTIEFCPST